MGSRSCFHVALKRGVKSDAGVKIKLTIRAIVRAQREREQELSQHRLGVYVDHRSRLGRAKDAHEQFRRTVGSIIPYPALPVNAARDDKSETEVPQAERGDGGIPDSRISELVW